jgi:DNA-binding transcriptional LysR family regulator
MRPVELRQLEYFTAVAEQLHFGRAAELLNIGQPAVSQQVRRLERDLGVQLFDRSSRAVRLTEMGHRFLPEARAVLAAAQQARQSIARGEIGTTLRIGTSTGLGDRLDEVLDRLRSLAPTLAVELVSVDTRTRLDRVRSGLLDAAFVRGGPDAAELSLVPLWVEELVVALPARHALARQERITFAALAGMPLRIASRRVNQPLVDLVIDTAAEAGFEPLPSSGSSNLADTLAAIGSSSDLWTVVYAAHARNLNTERVAFRAVDPPLTMPTSLAVRDVDAAGPAAFLRACRGVSNDRRS